MTVRLGRKRRARPGTQLVLRRLGPGGRRPGAGRPKKQGAGVSHRARPALNRHAPVHVTLRTVRGVWNLRSRRSFSVIRRAFYAGRDRFGFRLVHYSVQGNHLHLLVEAQDRRALSRGMQGLAIRLAKGLNRLMHRRGSVFRDRYYARSCRTPLETRRVLLYVLNNHRRHAFQRGEQLPRCWVDDFSSGPEFMGWDSSVLPQARRRFLDLPDAIAAPKSYLLRIGWRRHGRLKVDAIPGPRS